MALTEQNAANKLAALELAGKIFKVMQDDQLKALTPDERHKIVI